MPSDVFVPATEGIKYAGGKLRLLPHIWKAAAELSAGSVFDGFSGSTRVSQMLAKQGCRVIANDISVWSEIFATCYLLAERTDSEYQQMIDHLNSVKPEDGWFTQHYGGSSDTEFSDSGDGLKKPWQIHNTRKLDGIRQEIDRMNLNFADKSVMLTSLILALDKVENSLGHYSSYLKRWSARSYQHMALHLPKICRTDKQHQVLREDAVDAASRIDADLAYYDPPYGSNNKKMPASRVRYAAYYHIWKTVCLNDRPDIFGKAARREDSSDRVNYSPWEDFRKTENGSYPAEQELRNLIEATSARYVLLSYSSGGRASFESITDILENVGTIKQIVSVDIASNVMSAMRTTKEWSPDMEQPNIEWLFLTEK